MFEYGLHLKRVRNFTVTLHTSQIKEAGLVYVADRVLVHQSFPKNDFHLKGLFEFAMYMVRFSEKDIFHPFPLRVLLFSTQKPK